MAEWISCDRHQYAKAAYWAVKDMMTISLCGHCSTKHVDTLTEHGWELVPVPTERRVADEACAGS